MIAGIVTYFLYHSVTSLPLNQQLSKQPLFPGKITSRGPIRVLPPPGPNDPCPQITTSTFTLLNSASSNQSALLGSFPWACREIESGIYFLSEGERYWHDRTDFQDSRPPYDFYDRFFRIEVAATEPLDYFFLELETRTFHRILWRRFVSRYTICKEVAYNFTPGGQPQWDGPNWPLRVDIGTVNRRKACVMLVFYEWVPYRSS